MTTVTATACSDGGLGDTGEPFALLGDSGTGKLTC